MEKILMLKLFSPYNFVALYDYKTYLANIVHHYCKFRWVSVHMSLCEWVYYYLIIMYDLTYSYFISISAGSIVFTMVLYTYSIYMCVEENNSTAQKSTIQPLKILHKFVTFSQSVTIYDADTMLSSGRF